MAVRGPKPRPRGMWDNEAAPNHVRAEWTGKPVRLHHTAILFKYYKRTKRGRIREEAEHMRVLKYVALRRGYQDISYNYVVFPSGRVWVGRGEEVLGAHTIGHNADPGVALAGNFDQVRVSTRMRRQTSLLVSKTLPGRFGTRRRMIPHKATFPTACPGRFAVRAFKLGE